MCRIVNSFLDRWLAEAGRERVLMPEFRRLTFEIAAASLVGAAEDDADCTRIHALFNDLSQGLFALRLRWPGSTYGRALAARDALHIHLDRVIDRREAAAAATTTATEKVAEQADDAAAGGGGDLLDRMLAARDEQGDRLTRAELRCQSLVLLFAGHDTTASLMSSAFVRLSELSPKHRAALAEEQQSVVAAAAAAGRGAQEVGHEDLGRMPALDRFLQEVERLDPPVPGGFRVAQADLEFQGRRVPKGACAFYDVRSVNLLPVPGDPSPPDAFDPDRWLPDRRAAAGTGAGGFGMLTFGGGPRVCLGQTFARAEIKIFLSLLLRRCEWELSPGQDLSFALIPTLHRRSGIRAVFRGPAAAAAAAAAAPATN